MNDSDLRNRLAAGALALIGALTIPAALAQPVYKSTDKDGNTTYSSKPPTTAAEKAKTVEVPIDPDRNIVPAVPVPNTPQRSAGDSYSTSGDTGQTRAERIAEAEAALRAAEQAFAEGQTARPGDFIGRSGGGVGPSQQRIQRINELQAAVERARQALEELR